jgi:enoyl-[acyl-carrier protein] reductase II
MNPSFTHNSICQLFQIRYPIVQGGMVWCSGWRLASAVSNAGGLGLIGAGSMYPEVLREHIRKCQQATQKPFGVNVPLLYPDIEQIMQIIIEEGIKIVFTSAGNPATWTKHLKQHHITVVHVIANTKFAQKAIAAGVDAIVAEGFEAGGHNGREETTTMCLVPMIRAISSVPLIAAGGIGSGQAILAAMALGADGVQIGSLFAATHESSAHDNFKQRIVAAQEGDTQLLMKQITPVRLLKNEFAEQVKNLELQGASTDTLRQFLGKGRAKKGMFEGNLQEGELEIGQISAMIQDIKPVSVVMQRLLQEFEIARKKLI